VNRSSAPIPSTLPVIRVAEIKELEAKSRWLIENLWGAAAVGVIGGAPKSCKSWLGLDLALSVATGTMALGHFPVREQGPALIYLAEDSLDIVRERMGSLANHRGLDLKAVDVHVITAPTLRLDKEPDRSKLRETVRVIRPRLLLLDPLVRLHGVDENNATEVAELLSYLRELERAFDLAVTVVHHFRKNAPAGIQAGQGLRGSSDLHAFGDSNLYLRRIRDRLVLVTEHRAAAAPEPVSLRLVTEREDSVHLEIVDGIGSEHDVNRESLESSTLRVLKGTDGLTRDRLRERLGVKNERLGKVLAGLERAGQIERGPQGWRLGTR
jgi:AAA domain